MFPTFLLHALAHACTPEEVVTVTGSVWKNVQCENCGAEYSYCMQRKGTHRQKASLFYSEARARAIAEKRLRSNLENGFDIVPCPACGWYQRHMVPGVQGWRYEWMVPWALVAFGASLVLEVVGVVVTPLYLSTPPLVPFLLVLAVWALGGIALALAIGVLLTKYVLQKCFDPNRWEAGLSPAEVADKAQQTERLP